MLRNIFALTSAFAILLVLTASARIYRYASPNVNPVTNKSEAAKPSEVHDDQAAGNYVVPKGRRTRRSEDAQKNSSGSPLGIVEYIFREDLDKRIASISDNLKRFLEELGNDYMGSFLDACFPRAWKAYENICSNISSIPWKIENVTKTALETCQLSRPETVGYCEDLQNLTSTIPHILKLAVYLSRHIANDIGNTSQSVSQGIWFVPIGTGARTTGKTLSNAVKDLFRDQVKGLEAEQHFLRNFTRVQLSSSRAVLEEWWLKLATECAAFVRTAHLAAQAIHSGSTQYTCHEREANFIKQLENTDWAKKQAMFTLDFHEKVAVKWIEASELFSQTSRITSGLRLLAVAAYAVDESLALPTYSEARSISCALRRIREAVVQLGNGTILCLPASDVPQQTTACVQIEIDQFFSAAAQSLKQRVGTYDCSA